MIDQRFAPYAATVLRLSLGIMFVAHAVLKIVVFTPAGTAQFFGSVGLPGGLAYLTIAVELIGGMMLVLGVYSRYVALALIPVLLGAIVFVHGAAGWLFSAPNGGWEYPAFLIAASVVQALLGDGAYALRSSKVAPAAALAS
ncbi:MAG TPA: DoxX family protein [Gammaproteobacteria bacterium]|nr:DoxX family protein [Gammaproteobacteria bacterium]